MMNDRFSAQLRQHLLDTANERPADGRLTAIVEGVAVTAQRHPLVARLPWFGGRVGPFPSVATRFALVAVALIIAILGALAAGFGGSRSTDFEGTWRSVDPADGSTQTLIVGAGTSPGVHFEDAFATGPACVADEVKVFTMEGIGSITDSLLEVTWPDGGGCGLRTIEVGPGAYTHDQGSDTLADNQGLIWTRVGGRVVPPTPSPTAEPSLASPAPSTSLPTAQPGEATFTSAIHGISIDYPSTWQTKPATEAWTGGPLDFDSPAADVIFDPTLRDGLYLLVASQPYGALTQDAWRDEILAWTCPGQDGGEMWSWRVDGSDSWQQGPCNSGSIVFTDFHGYLIRLVVSSTEPGLAEAYDWEWLKDRLETVDLRPAPAAGTSECVEYRNGGSYRQSVDPLTVTATLPAGTDNGWWSASRTVFAAASEPCLFGPAIRLEVSGPAMLSDDACQWRDSTVDVRSRADAQATLSQNGLESTSSTDVALGGYLASRFEVSVPEGFDLTRCDAGELRLWTSGPGRHPVISPDETVRVYLVDVDGLILGLTVTSSPGDERLPAKMAELEGILASMHIEHQ